MSPYHSSKPDKWTEPRPYQDASLRYRTHGPLQPLHEPSWWERLFGK